MDQLDIDEFLSRPLVCHIATAPPRLLPLWYLWEGGCFWVLTGPWSRLGDVLRADPRVVLVVDSCDPATGETLQVLASGSAELVAFDVARGRRLLERYLGSDLEAWDPRFRSYVSESAGSVWARLQPERLIGRDLSFQPSRRSPGAPHRVLGAARTAGVGTRVARLDDIEALVHLLASLFADEREFTVDPARQRMGLAELLSRPDRGLVLVAESEGALVGMLSLQLLVSTALGGTVALLEDLVVDPALRGVGIGARLLAAGLATAERLGCRRVTLLTDEGNVAARRFYERQGFMVSPMTPMRRALTPPAET